MPFPHPSRPSPALPATRWRLSALLAAGSVGVLVAGVVATAPGPAYAADAGVGLGTASSFAVLAGSTVTNTGTTVITGDLGLSPGSSVTGFPPGIVTGGTQHVSDEVAEIAHADLITAYNDAAGRPATADVTDQDLGNMTLTPGVYEATTSMAITGTLTLDAQGDPLAVFIFKAGSTLVTASDSRVQFVNGGSPCNVFWQVGTSATLGTATRFLGTIMTLASATLATTASVEGRVLARTGAVTLDTNVVTAPVCADSAGAATASPTLPATLVGKDDGPTPGPLPGPTPTEPVIPKDHPRTGLGGTSSSPASHFVLAGLIASAAAIAGGLGFRRVRTP